MKKTILFLAAILGIVRVSAQVKIGDNPTDIIPCVQLQINGGSSMNDIRPGSDPNGYSDFNTFVFYEDFQDNCGNVAGKERGSRVGIGTTFPLATLDIVSKDSHSTEIGLRNYSRNGVSKAGHDWAIASLGTENANTAGSFMLWDNSAFNGNDYGANRFIINPFGHVGIGGIESPTTNLDIWNDGQFSSRAQIALGTYGGHKYFLSSNGTCSSGNNCDGPNKPNSFMIWDGEVSKSRLFISSEGKIGIGNNNYDPMADLDVMCDGIEKERAQLGLRANGGHNYFISSEGLLNGATTPNPTAGGLVIFDGTENQGRLFIKGNGKIGINNNYNPATELDVNGSITALAIQGPSDIRFKKNIKPLENSLEKISKLKGHTYHWRRDEFPDKKFKSGTDIGLIAQEVEKVYPEVVYTADDEMKSKSIDYAKLVPALVEAIKELQKEVEELKSQMPLQKR
ncbi:tail fiber domain-containing protein [Flavobacterium sp. CYK-4]|uniref:tail fiber domain-containing protein n=1 Tax=Flavobacterium lotistagni TaxID=2709660 RepID=UPI001408433D|nr:tail fiber domain-containing protein [Flavobacterium lotistagni]NHM05814.1 tail fiber domain-containing protein [Flavobacterium lotistagni]